MSKLADLYNKLTPSEEEVYHMVCLDISVDEISKQLSISPTTTRYHIDNVFKKFQVTNRYQLIAKSYTPLWREVDEDTPCV
jgi:DNA-binding CsgD family transcriptional regulator